MILMTTPIRTRFAPSPTGYLHIGGVRTAMFAWLLVKRHGGQFVLRIDDTDGDRNRPEALQPILDGFRFLGMDWDEGPEIGGPYGPYFQSQRGDLYMAAAMKLLEAGLAYPDYLSREELDAEKKTADTAKRAYVHRGPLRDNDPADNVRRYRERPTTLRFKIPDGRTIVVDDLICGQCSQKSDLLGDLVILRADGRALYNFASVVDDAMMKMTHVLRAREHLTNTYPQVLIFEALGYELPRFGHLPNVNEPNSKKKLSKRDMAKFVTPEIRGKLQAIGYTGEQIEARDDLNPATVAFYQEMGYLPDAVLNYLCRLGWSLDDKTEFFPRELLIASFGLERVNDAAASFDPNKFFWVAGEHMKIQKPADKLAGCLPFLRKAGMIGDAPDAQTLAKIGTIVAAMGDRMKLFSDIIAYARPFLASEVEYDPKAVEKRLKKPGAVELLQRYLPELEAATAFDAPSLDTQMHVWAEANGVKIGEMVHPVRVAISGVEVGVSLFEAMAILGKDTTIARMKTAIAMV